MTKKTNKKTIRKKKTIKKDDNFESSGILILSVIGIVVLIYFGVNTDIKGDNSPSKTELETKQPTTEQIDKIPEQNSIMIDGLIYPSKEYALKKLKDIPQTKLTEEQRRFVINPNGFKN